MSAPVQESAGFSDFSAYGPMADFAPPGMKEPIDSTTALRAYAPQEWYKNFTRVFSESEELRIFPDRTSVGVLNADMMTLINVAFAVQQHTFAIHRDMDNMDANDPYVSVGLDTLVNGALGMEYGGAMSDGRPFAVQCDDYPIVGEIIDALCRRASVYDDMWQMGRNAVKYGNEFREVVLDSDYQTPIQAEHFQHTRGCIVRFDYRPEHQLWPNFDKKGNRIPGFVQQGRMGFRGANDIEYQDWQVVHFRFGGHSDVSWGKGTPLFYSCRRLWRKLQYLEEGLILARISRAYPKFLHKIPMPVSMATDQTTRDILMSSYVDAVTRKREMNLARGTTETQFNPTDVTSDFFVGRYFYAQPNTTPVDTDVTVLEASNVQLTSLEDVKYLQDKLIARSCVPRRFFGIEEKASTTQVDKSGAGQQDVQFARMLKTVQQVLERGLRRLFNLELMLHGLDPNQIDYHIVWPEVSTIDPMSRAELSLTMANAAKGWQEVFQGGLSTRILVSRFLREPHEDVDVLVAEIEESTKKAKEEAQQSEVEAAAAWNAPGAAEERGIYDKGSDGGGAPPPPNDGREAQAPTPDAGMQALRLPLLGRTLLQKNGVNSN